MTSGQKRDYCAVILPVRKETGTQEPNDNVIRFNLIYYVLFVIDQWFSKWGLGGPKVPLRGLQEFHHKGCRIKLCS